MNLRQAIALDSKHARAHNNLALVLAQNGALNDSLAEFHKGGSNAASAHANLGFVLTMQRRWDDARTQYKLALAADPSSTELAIRLQQLDSLAAKLNPSPEKIAGTQDARVMTASADIAQQSSRPISVSASVGQPSTSNAGLTTQSAYRESLRPDSAGPRPIIPPPIEFKASRSVETDNKRPAIPKPFIPPPRTRVQQPAQPPTGEPADNPTVARATIAAPITNSGPNSILASQSSASLPLESAR